MNEFYDLVPKDFDANLKFRREIISQGCSDKKAAEELWIMCSRDPLFYCNAFVWTYDPRIKPIPAIPFITYDYQDEAIMKIESALGSHDLFIEKSRDMGASWLCLLGFEYRFHFKPLQSFLCVSRKEDLVDKTEDPDSLFWKIDFIHKHQPGWLRPNVNRTKLHIYNIDNGSTIDGSSTTGDVGRGGRRTGILLDEFASVDDGHAVLRATRDTTNCRLFNSTPKGTGNAFYEIKQTDVAKLRMHWRRHPVKSKGLYCSEDGLVKRLDDFSGIIEIGDKEFRYPQEYSFITDGKLRSPWYDEQLRRAAHTMEIAQELDIDYLGSDYQFFDQDVLDRVQRRFVREPYLRGDIDFDRQSGAVNGFIERKNGPLLLWANVDAAGNLPADRDYVLGCDISAGTGASNSCVSIGDRKTNEKIGELTAARLKPHEFARKCVAIANWLKGPTGTARMIWEANGPGREFGDMVLELGYRNIHYRENERSLSKKTSDVPGWWATKETKLTLLGAYRKALAEELFIQRSYHSVAEAREYIFTASGSVEHARSVNTVDPSGARDNHGDRVIADALCSRALADSNIKRSEEVEPTPDTFAGRRLKRQQEKRKKVYW